MTHIFYFALGYALAGWGLPILASLMVFAMFAFVRLIYKSVVETR